MRVIAIVVVLVVVVLFVVGFVVPRRSRRMQERIDEKTEEAEEKVREGEEGERAPRNASDKARERTARTVGWGRRGADKVASAGRRAHDKVFDSDQGEAEEEKLRREREQHDRPT